jgi:hypothetical protein
MEAEKKAVRKIEKGDIVLFYTGPLRPALSKPGIFGELHRLFVCGGGIPH